VSLFYIAFIKAQSLPLFGQQDVCHDSEGNVTSDCMTELSTQLTSLLVARVVISNLQEVALPWILLKYNVYKKEKEFVASTKLAHPDWSDEQCLTTVRSTVAEVGHQAETEAQMQTYGSGPISGTFDDYNELAIQFGYVVLFAPAFPLAPLIALCSNFLDTASDGFRIVFKSQKPHYSGANNIGTWFYIFSVISTISVLTNSAIIGFTSDELNVFISNPTDFQKLCVVVVIEHVVFFIQVMIRSILPEEPSWLRVVKARTEAIRKIETDYEDYIHSDTKDDGDHKDDDALLVYDDDTDDEDGKPKRQPASGGVAPSAPPPGPGDRSNSADSIQQQGQGQDRNLSNSQQFPPSQEPLWQSACEVWIAGLPPTITISGRPISPQLSPRYGQ